MKNNKNNNKNHKIMGRMLMAITLLVTISRIARVRTGLLKQGSFEEICKRILQYIRA